MYFGSEHVFFWLGHISGKTVFFGVRTGVFQIGKENFNRPTHSKGIGRLRSSDVKTCIGGPTGYFSQVSQTGITPPETQNLGFFFGVRKARWKGIS